jgi:hypothetical protein
MKREILLEDRTILHKASEIAHKNKMDGLAKRTPRKRLIKKVCF